MKTLTLSLKRKWFDLIKAGVKKEEYREIKPRYLEMFCTQYEDHTEHALPNHSNDFKVSFHLLWPEELQEKFDKIVFTLGYPKSDDAERRMEFNNPKIRIDEGKPEWGAEPGKKYFVITWEDA